MSGLGLTPSSLGLNLWGLGLTRSSLGLNLWGLGLTPSGLGVNLWGLGLTPSGLGLNSSGLGLTRSSLALNSTSQALSIKGQETCLQNFLHHAVTICRSQPSNDQRSMMTNANRRPASGRNAKKSRRAGVRSRGSRLKGRESWRRLFQRGRRNLRSAEGFLGMARQIIERCETIALEHPIKAVHDMYRVTGLLVEATKRFGRVLDCICEMYDRIAEAPGECIDAPALMIADLQSWIETGTKLALLGNRFDKSFAELIDYVQSGNAPLDMSELHKRRSHPVPVLARHPAPRVLSIENDRIFCIHIRRQRSVRVTVAEAPRRVSRGRAPPLVSTCSL